MKKLLPFIGGLLTACLISFCVGGALAASPAVQFNTAAFSVNQHVVLEQGQNLQTPAGASVPSVILYTDELGEKTHYVPVRYLAKLFHMPLTWDGNRVNLEVGADDLGTYVMPLYSSFTVEGILREVDPVPKPEGTALLSSTRHASEEGFEKVLTLRSSAGDHISITIQNDGPYPLRVGLGYKDADGSFLDFTQAPAGASVTRTVQVLPGGWDAQPYLTVGNPDDITRPIDVTVSAVQFDPS